MSQALDFRLPDGRMIKCAVEKSFKAKRVLLKLSPERGLRMICPALLPVGMGEKREILEKMRPWIEKQVAAMESAASVPEQHELPGRVELAAIGEVWPVVYSDTQNRRTTLEVRGQSLHVAGPDRTLFTVILQQWLMDTARCWLPESTARLAGQLGFKINRVTVKRQKTRWGSCSAKGNINLNYRLMLLPPELTRFVIVHELCHLKHMNHGEKFHALLQTYYPNHKELDKELRRAERALEWWT